MPALLRLVYARLLVFDPLICFLEVLLILGSLMESLFMLFPQRIKLLLHLGEPQPSGRQSAQGLKQTKSMSHCKNDATPAKMEWVRKLTSTAND